MPILKEETIEIELPYSKAKVKIRKRFTYGAILDFRSQKIENEQDAKVELASTLIYDWDLTDDKGKKLEINRENIKRLDNDDGNFLINKVNEAITEKKNFEIDIFNAIRGDSSIEIPSEYVMYRLSEKFGWTEKEILNTSYNYISSIIKIMRIEYDYNKWLKDKKNGV